MPRISPDSDHPLQAIDFHGFHLDVCPQTGGIWFDVGEIAKLARVDPTFPSELRHEAEGQEPPAKAEGTRQCPNDGSALKAFFYAEDHNVRIDGCPVCNGVWVDRSDLDGLAQHTARTAPSGANTTMPKLSPEAATALAQMQMQHDEFMMRASAATQFFQTIDQWAGMSSYYRRRF